MEFGVAIDSFYGDVDFGVGAGDENVLLRTLVAEHGTDDFGDLKGSFALAENDFRIALTQRAMMIDLGEIDVFEGQVLEALDSRFGREFLFFHAFQDVQ